MAGIGRGPQHRAHLAIIQRRQQFQRFGTAAIGRVISAEQARSIGGQRRHQGLAARLQFLEIARQGRLLGIAADATVQKAGQAFGNPDLALGIAADDRQEQVVDEDLARRQSCLPAVLDQVAHRIVIGRIERNADPAANDVVIDDEARRTDGAQGGGADDLAMIDLVGVGGLEGKALEIDRLHQGAVAQRHGAVVEQVVVGQPLADALFLLEPAREAALHVELGFRFIRHWNSLYG